jgi:hypothetical protein
MPRQQSWFTENVQPINWSRAALSGVCGCMIMMAFVDSFYMMGVTPFCFENYLGSLILENTSSGNLWTIGFLANMAIGGVIGLFYAFFFEFVYKRADVRIGLKLGFYHAILAAVAIFPFFRLLGTHMRLQLHPVFGFFGSALGVATPLVLLFAHLIYGLTMGAFYGPVRMNRVLARYMEPEDTFYQEEIYRHAKQDRHSDRAA